MSDCGVLAPRVRSDGSRRRRPVLPRTHVRPPRAVFAAAVILARVSSGGKSSAALDAAGTLYVALRIAHIFFYATGSRIEIAVLRSASWVASMVVIGYIFSMAM